MSNNVSKVKRPNLLNKKPNVNGWCLYEDHFWNGKTKTWEKVSDTNGLKMCRHSKCTRRHKLPNRPTEICKNEETCQEAELSCILLHDFTKIKPVCYYAGKCCDLECVKYRHPKERTTDVCDRVDDCPDALISCFKLHNLSKIPRVCKFNKPENLCVNFICQKRHRKERKPCCDNGSMCYEYITKQEQGCDKLHPKILQKICRYDNTERGCLTYGCPYAHNPLSKVDCDVGMQCQLRESSCNKKHPKFTKSTVLPDGSIYFE